MLEIINLNNVFEIKQSALELQRSKGRLRRGKDDTRQNYWCTSLQQL